MKAIMVMFDSLNRHMLPAYGCDWVKAPNFDRLQNRTVTFDNCYVGSMPCMPARRELHTGRYNFLHRSWGPMEPFDDSMPEILKNNGVYCHLVSDHQHYWEDGGCNYHTRYSSWEAIRGQEGDAWKGFAGEVETPDDLVEHKCLLYRQDMINREYMKEEKDFPQTRTFDAGLEFLERNCNEDEWFLQIECFDPHEPFMTSERFRELYPMPYGGPHNDWPDYKSTDGESQELIEHLKYEYAALLTMCDMQLGRVLDMMDEHDMWDDTMLIVCTDHGFLLGEHDWWGKNLMPWYNHITNTPLFIWDPRSGLKDERRDALVQMIDMPVTLLNYFDVSVPEDMQGKDLGMAIEEDDKIRDAALFGIFGGHVNCTDGRYVYMRGAANEDNKPLHQYTLMTTHLRSRFNVEEVKTMAYHEGFSFTKGAPVMRFDAGIWDTRDIYSMSGYAVTKYKFDSYLYDLKEDPGQHAPIEDKVIEERMTRLMKGLMKQNDAPLSQYERLGLI